MVGTPLYMAPEVQGKVRFICLFSFMASERTPNADVFPIYPQMRTHPSPPADSVRKDIFLT
jgi:hypothetical protein